MKKIMVMLTIAFLFAISLPIFASYNALSQPEVQDYIEQMVNKYNFDPDKLQYLFSTVIFNDEVVMKLSKPAEAKPWYEYQDLLITPERIEKGLAYWKTHEKILAQAEKKYGVPASIIIAIIGVETKYGENKGNYPVFSTLTTLGFNHGKREKFFRSELTEYLLLTRENKLKPLLLKGSYAGAVGLPQFMPSSYRHYAIDFQDKGFADLFDNHHDAIASVANYLRKHGWKTGEPVAIAAKASGEEDYSQLQGKNYKPIYTIEELAEYDIYPTQKVTGKVSFIRLEGRDSPEYWLGLQNFYAITTYNKSELYVMAVKTLADKLRAKRYSHH